MNFRNISSWCIRNPVPPIVLFVGLMLAGLVAFTGMDVNNNPDIDFPAAMSTSRSPARRRPRWKIRSRRRSKRRSARSTASTRSTARSARATATPSSSSKSARRPTARSMTCATPFAQIRGDLPDGILEPQISRVDIAGDPILFVAAQTTDMTLEQLSWYVDNNVVAHACLASKALPRSPGKAGSTGRSASFSTLPHCRRKASPRHRSTSSFARPTSTPRAGASRLPAPNSRSGSSATRATPMNYRRRRSSFPAGARSGWPILARSRMPIRSSAPSPR